MCKKMAFYFGVLLFAVLQIYVLGYDKNGLNQIYSDFWEWRKLNSPEFFSYVGIHGHNDLLKSFNVSQFDKRKEMVDVFLQRLRHLKNKQSMPDEDLTEYEILDDYLSSYIKGYQWRYYQSLNPLSFMEGLQTNPSFITLASPFISRGDYENYIDRLIRLTTQINEIKESFTEAIQRNHTYHRVSIEHVPKQIRRHIRSDPKKFILYKPLRKLLQNNTWISNDQKSDLRQRAALACSDVMAAWTNLADFLENVYLNHTRSGPGISSWTNGAELYRALLKWHLSLDITPEEVHKTGLQEVKRISLEMTQSFERIGHKGTVREFFNQLKNGSKFTFNSKDDILSEYKDVVYRRIYPSLPKIFNNIPVHPVRVVPLPYDGAQGLYVSGSADKSGQFMVNLFRPKEDLKFTFMALSLHEAVPGHHFQISIQNEAKIPQYRRYLEIRNYFLPPFQFPFYSAYVEGWGLYAEYLGEELGLYKDDYEMIGRYSFEIFRACRLVVDTGIHYFNWTREQAIDYMMNYTILSRELISNDVNRYITWPGQACAYKIGELKIKEMRQKAKSKLGNKFSLKEFHEIFLKNGPMPLRVLERIFDKWIEKKKTMTDKVSACTSDSNILHLSINLLISVIMFYTNVKTSPF